jgi:mono/diheme cytochrome c family protein
VRPSRSAAALVAAVFFGMPVAGAYEPRVNYQLQCMGCHHADGAGEPGRVPSVRDTLVPLSLFAEGRDFVLRVPGVAQSPLTDAEVAALLNWMARNVSDVAPGDGFRDYTAEEVGARRHQPLVAIAAERERLLARVGHR